jgi:ribosome-associated toxin RatA of RatAB toxin-antitoxin module
MRPGHHLLLLVAFAGLHTFMFAAEPVSPANDTWKPEGQGGNVALFSQPRANTSFKKFKAIGEIDAPIRVVHSVIDDFASYTHFMPFTVECRVVKRDSGGTFFYQRLSPKIVSDRDYTLRVREKSWKAQGSAVCQHSFEAANEAGPPEAKGYTRVKVCEGAWLLESLGPDKTRATYTLDTDNGGKVPAFIANPASEMAIRKVFAAIRKQAKDPKYTVAER